MATVAAELGEIKLELWRRREGESGEGDGVFQNQAKLMVVMVEAKELGFGLFIGHQWRFAGGRSFRRGEIFSRAPRLSPACACAPELKGGAEQFILIRCQVGDELDLGWPWRRLRSGVLGSPHGGRR